MSRRKHRRSSRRVTWLAFGVVALAALAHAQDAQHDATQGAPDKNQPGNVEVGQDQATEATRAYRQAISTLSALTAQLPGHTREASFNPYQAQNTPLLASFLPSIHGHGPVASALRIAQRLRQNSWMPSFISGRHDRSSSSRKKDEELKGKAIKVLDLLLLSTELGNMDALFALAKLSLLPPSIHFPSDPDLAYKSFVQHAHATGNATSQAYLGFFYSTGYRGVVPVDQGMAQLYYTFAGHGGDKGAQMTLGYRSWNGIGTLQDCNRAIEWYSEAAEQAMAKFLSGPPGGRTLPLTSTRLSDLSGGVYGPGASVASTGINSQRAVIKAADARAAGQTWQDIVEYYLFSADRGDQDFALRLGKVFYHGSLYAARGGIASGSEGVGAVPRDYARARFYFLSVARELWPKDPQNPLQHQSLAPAQPKEGRGGEWAGSAASFLGRMYLRGEGVKQDFNVARMWFERAAERKEREGHNGLGIIWRDGLTERKKDVKKAMYHFGIAAGRDLAEAQVNLGKIYYNAGNIKTAVAYFDAAVRSGSPFEAFYYLAKVQHQQAKSLGVNPDIATGSCSTAVSFYKLVAERGSWFDDPVHDAEVEWSTETNRGSENAMLLWWIAAERGYEVAQNNLAYVLDQDKSVLRLTRFAPLTPSNDTARLALMQWTRSSAQHNIDALVKVGDYYYHALGVPEEPEAVRWEKAAMYYRAAADTQLSALAMWNLGWMYENGRGVPQDFHLAKRYYDMAMETNSEAYIPVMASLIKLYARSFWHTLTGGEGGLSIFSSEDDYGYDEYQDPAPAIDGTNEHDTSQIQSEDGQHHEEYDTEEEGSWYLGKAREQFNKRKQGQFRDRRDDEDDLVEWARRRREADERQDSDYDPEDYFDAAVRGGNRERQNGDDDFTETAILIGLVLLVTALIFLRARIVERIRREEREQAQPNGAPPPQPGQVPDAGLFPPPGDPARQDWAILR